jgi:very-short-patch-repair endonuclease
MSAQDTWAQLSGGISLTDLIVMGDFLLTSDEPYSGVPSPFSRDDLEAAARRHGRRPGVRNLRLALERIRYGSLSPQESRLRIELTDAGLPEPHLNHRIMKDGRLLAMVDLAYPDQRVAIEYLGDHHRTDPDVFQADIYRRERLTAAGWNVIFVTAADLHGPVPRAVSLVRHALHNASSISRPVAGVSTD